MRITTGSDYDPGASAQALLANLKQDAAFGVLEFNNLGSLCAEFGMEAAQQAITEFSRKTKEFLRESDSVIELSDTRVYFAVRDLVDPNHLLLAALKLERLFQDPLEYHGMIFNLKVVAGWVYCSEAILGECNSRSQLCGLAERSLEQAYLQSATYHINSAEELEVADTVPGINNAVLRAIDTHDLNMDYQPKYNLANGELVGAEALVRWRRDGLIIPPDEFLPLLSQDALWQLTRHCLRSVIRSSLDLPTATPTAINIDPSCLGENLFSLIQDELTLFSVSPSRIMLEITESGVIQDSSESFAVLRRVQELGVKISIDDFGTGHSSFHRFRDLPADEIKLDRCFIHNIVTDSANQKITQTMIELCRRFSKTVVAEGIEDGDTVAYLSEAGCDVGQGFYLGAPMSKELYRSLLSKEVD